MTDDRTSERASTLLRLHQAPELLTVVNVWDVISAAVVADVPGTTALATASHSIAATFGYKDGENMPLELMLSGGARLTWPAFQFINRRITGRVDRLLRWPHAHP